MNAHALEVLEFGRVLERVARRASSEQGRRRIRALRPVSDRLHLLDEFARLDETLAYRESHPSWAPPAVPDADRALKRIGVEGAVLEAEELHSLGVLLESCRGLGDALEEEPDAHPHLVRLAGRLPEDEDLEREIGKSVQKDGHVLDSASPDLRRIRATLRKERGRIVETLEKFLSTLPERVRVSDASVSLRDGRYVVPVRREGRSEVGGIVHGESGSGATLFIEPQVAVELMNAVKELESDESQEILRILRRFTERLRPRVEELEEGYDALVEFDTLWARARTAEEWDAAPPELLEGDPEELEIRGGRHPLLLEGETAEVVPFDLRLEPGEHVLVVSGPNTGGKTVFLKAVGLCATLTQAGVVPPVRPGTRLPLFDDVFADIGDEQSIAESLSTFSAHLENLRTIVEGADHRSLVLVDEMGTGTDPAEGAALARSILEEMVDRGARAVVTSHLGALKRLDAEGSGIVNASLQFDPDAMEPTYRLRKGRPGRSYGLAIARRLGFPGTVLDRAEEHLSEEEVRVEELLERLERHEKDAASLVEEREEQKARALTLRESIQRRQAELEERKAHLEEKEADAERRRRDEARRLLLEAREEVEKAIEEVRNAASAEALEEAGRRARSRVEEAARRQLESRPGESPERTLESLPELAPGDRVQMVGSGAKGTVVEVRQDRAIFETGGLRMEAPLADLAPLGAGKGEGDGNGHGDAASGSGSGWTGPDPGGSSEVDFRGLRVADLERELPRALDRAVMSGLPELRIIHGKGTGALREKVEEVLREDERISDFGIGRPQEGGAGVTIARFS